MGFETVPEITVPVPGNGQYDFYIVTQAQKRIISISGAYTGTYNLDSFLGWGGSDSLAWYLDSTLNRGTPYDIPLGHLNEWIQETEHLMFQVTNWAVAGNVTVRLRFETVDRGAKAPQKVSVEQSIEIDTKPFGRLFR